MEISQIGGLGPTEVDGNHHQRVVFGLMCSCTGQTLPCKQLWAKVGTREKIAKIKRAWKLKFEMVEND